MGFFRYFTGLALAVGLSLGHVTVSAQEAATLSAAAPPAAAATAAEAPPPLIPAGHFARRSAFWDTQLSPDGSMFAFMRDINGQTIFVITATGSGQLVRALRPDPDDDLTWYTWVTNDKLLLGVSTPGQYFGEDSRYTRLVLVEVSTGVMTRLFARSEVLEVDNVIHIAKDGSHVLVTIQKTPYDYPSVMRN
jgi:hypothetical protein